MRYISNFDEQGVTKRDLILPDYGRTVDDYIRAHKAPFDAIVFIDCDKVVAVDSDGKTIDDGEAGVDDTTVIKSAVEYGRTTVIKGGDGVTYSITDTVTITDTKELIGYGYPWLIADSSVNKIISIEGTSRVSWTRIERVFLIGNNKAKWGLIDSAGTRHLRVIDVYAKDFTEGVIKISPSQESNFGIIKGLWCDNVPNAVFFDGSNAIPHEFIVELVEVNSLNDNGTEECSGWAGYFKDVQKNHIRKFYVGSRTTDVNGAIMLKSTTQPCIANVFEQIVWELKSDATKGYGVHIYADANGKRVFGNEIRGITLDPLGQRPWIKLEHGTNAAGWELQGTTIKFFGRADFPSATIVEIGSGVGHTVIKNENTIWGTLNNTHISDNGRGTVVNGLAQEAAGVGGAPNTAYYVTGDIVHNIDDDTFWIKDRAGNMRQIA